jgi:hypothetical protein
MSVDPLFLQPPPSSQEEKRVRGSPCPHGCGGEYKVYNPLMSHFLNKHLALKAADIPKGPMAEQAPCPSCHLRMRRALIPVHAHLFHDADLLSAFYDRAEAVRRRQEGGLREPVIPSAEWWAEPRLLECLDYDIERIPTAPVPLPALNGLLVEDSADEAEAWPDEESQEDPTWVLEAPSEEEDCLMDEALPIQQRVEADIDHVADPSFQRWFQVLIKLVDEKPEPNPPQLAGEQGVRYVFDTFANEGLFDESWADRYWMGKWLWSFRQSSLTSEAQVYISIDDDLRCTTTVVFRQQKQDE